MRRVAASRVYLNGKEFHTNYVVELFDHLLVNYYPLEGEIAMTEWLGGTIIIRGREAYHTRDVLSPTELSTYDSGCNSDIKRL